MSADLLQCRNWYAVGYAFSWIQRRYSKLTELIMLKSLHHRAKITINLIQLSFSHKPIYGLYYIISSSIQLPLTLIGLQSRPT